MEQMNYDEADLFAIEHGAAANGIRLDEGESIFTARELDYVKTRFTKSNIPH